MLLNHWMARTLWCLLDLLDFVMKFSSMVFLFWVQGNHRITVSDFYWLKPCMFLQLPQLPGTFNCMGEPWIERVDLKIWILCPTVCYRQIIVLVGFHSLLFPWVCTRYFKYFSRRVADFRLILNPLRLRDDLRPQSARACGRRAAVSSPSDQGQARIHGALCSTRASKSSQHKNKEPVTEPNVCRGLGNSWNVIPGPWQLGQFKERAGFLISLTLLAAPPWAEQYLSIFLVPQKKMLIDVFLHWWQWCPR